MKPIQSLMLLLFINFCVVTNAQKNGFDYKKDYLSYLKRSQDSSSTYYYKKLKNRVDKADVTLNSKELLHLLIYTPSSPDYDPILLDTLSRRLYDANEHENYRKAIVLADSILRLVPINLTALKEKTLALKKLGIKADYNKYSALTKKLIEALLISGDGYYEHPFFGVNFFEGVSFYEAVYQCHPSKAGIILDKKGRLLAAFYGYSPTRNNIMIQYFQVDHAREYYEPNTVEGEE